MTNLNQTDKNTHKNHRQRLKNKVLKFGLECLEYHEILEFLLTYTIPRKDTNPIAHKLIAHFGSFEGVLNADYYDLLKVEGIGPESALFISSIMQVMDMYNKNKMENKSIYLKSTSQCVQFFRESYRIKMKEFLAVACLSKNKKVVKTYVVNGIDETQIVFDTRTILNNLDANVKGLVLYHTHPNGNVEPSKEDIETTQTLLNLCSTMGVSFDDHIILNENSHYSFKTEGWIDNMRSKYQTMFYSNINNLKK